VVILTGISVENPPVAGTAFAVLSAISFEVTPMADPQVVLITGATSGIGRATAKMLAANGYRVFGTGRPPTTDTLDGFDLLPLEVTDDDSVAACVRTVLDRAGRIDVLVNNVGTGILGAAEESSAADVRDLFDINLFGAVRMTNAVLPQMRARRSGKIVNMSSSGGHAAVPFAAYYCATKHALEAYSAALRAELLPLGLFVSVVGPGPVSTPAGDKASRPPSPIPDYEPARSKSAEKFVQAIRDGMPPERVAETILGVVQSSDPAPRYPVGGQARAVDVARRVLPTRLFQAAVRWATKPA
jgi:NAD(P)-dependent dehydrogenase (short-subunit alcohol dehydrogenase family)